jgi:hypothetical protein
LLSLSADDPILIIEYGEELRKLERLLSLLIPDEENGREHD